MTRVRWLAACSLAAAVAVGVVVAATRPGHGVVTHGSRDLPWVALTFDADLDPSMLRRLRSGEVRSWYAEDIVAILRAESVPATVFVTGLWAQTYPDAVRSLAADPLFEIGNHSMTHAPFRTPCEGLGGLRSDNERRREAAVAEAAITAVAGVSPRFFRFPDGCHDVSDAELVRALGEEPVGWDVASGDAVERDPGVVARNVLAGVRPGSIVVMHLNGAPNAPATAAALRVVIPRLRGRGYRFVTVGQLLAARGHRLVTVSELLAAGPRPKARRSRVAELSARQKAALVVVSGSPWAADVENLFVGSWNRGLQRPRGALVFADQEGGPVRALPASPPRRAAIEYTHPAGAFAAGRATGRALRRAGIHVALAPVLDSSTGPLGVRHFRDPALGIAFARGLAAARAGSCVKHFPGLGSTSVSTDRARAKGIVSPAELDGFRAAIRSGVPCVLVSHAIYPKLGHRPASLEPATYRLLRRTGFDGVAITDDLDVLGRRQAARSARLAIEAGADLVLFTSGRDAERAIEALVPLARRGLLDDNVARIRRLRRLYGSR